MNEREFLEEVRGLPLFTTKQVAALLGNREYAKLFLHRLVERKVIARLRRGYYTVHEDPVIWATHVRYPSYISLWYALQHHGVTTQIPGLVEVVCAREDSFGGVEFVRSPHLWGYGRVNYSGFQVAMSDLEKVVIDAVYTGRVPPDELEAAVAGCDVERLERYLLMTDVSTVKRVGYVCERFGVFLRGAHERAMADRNYVTLPGRVGENRWRVRSDRR